jgi:hypothetical protein
MNMEIATGTDDLTSGVLKSLMELFATGVGNTDPINNTHIIVQFLPKILVSSFLIVQPTFKRR